MTENDALTKKTLADCQAHGLNILGPVSPDLIAVGAFPEGSVVVSNTIVHPEVLKLEKEGYRATPSGKRVVIRPRSRKDS